MREVMARALLLTAVLALGAPGGAEIYKCLGADGKMLFTITAKEKKG